MNERHLTLKQKASGLGARVCAAIAVLMMLAAASACREGEGVTVRSLAFEGVKQVSETELRLAVTTTGSSRIPWVRKTYFSKQDFAEDLKRLESFYVSRGFTDAHVTSYRTNYNADKTEMDLTVIIDEGIPVIVDRVEFVGFDALPEGHLDALKSRQELTLGQPRDQERAEVLRGVALDELRDHGYPSATVAMSERTTTHPKRLAVTYTAAPGAFAKFGTITVKGNATVSADVILRQMAFRTGDVFSLTRIQTSQRRLYNLELFQFANVEVGDASATPGEAPITITVVEAPHRQQTIGIGYGSEEHARIEGTFKHVNFLGGARTANAEARFSSLDRGVRLSFTDPAIGRGTSLAGSGQTWYSSTPAYTLRTSGGRLGFLRTLSRGELAGGSRARGSMSLAFAREHESYRVSEEALKDEDFRPTLIALGLNPLTGEGSGTVSSVIGDIQRNTVSNLLDARRGSLLSVHAEAAGRVAGGTYAYRELSGEVRTFIPLGPSVVVALHGRAGSIGGSGDPDSSVPFFKRYFLGGATSLRGWGRFEVAPLTTAGLPIGGYSMLETSAELRLTPSANSVFGIVGFIDAGNVWDKSWRLYPNDLKSDVGVGLRYRTPVGPLRFDLAYQLTPIDALVLGGRAAGDYRRWRFHFSIGQAF